MRYFTAFLCSSLNFFLGIFWGQCSEVKYSAIYRYSNKYWESGFSIIGPGFSFDRLLTPRGACFREFFGTSTFSLVALFHLPALVGSVIPIGQTLCRMTNTCFINSLIFLSFVEFIFTGGRRDSAFGSTWYFPGMWRTSKLKNWIQTN